MIQFNEIHRISNLFQKDISSLTWQEIKFYDIVANKITYDKLSDNVEKIKKDFLFWQSNLSPKKPTPKKYNIGEFNHKDDMSWLSLDTWIDIVKKDVESKTIPVDLEIEKMISEEFPL